MKITRATLKSFINKNRDRLYINCKSSFNGMVDMVTDNDNAGFKPVQTTDRNEDYTLGIGGLWLVGSSRDYFTEYNDSKYHGIEVYNSCGTSIVAVKV